MKKQKEIEVLLVDDQKMIREGLRNTINQQQNLAVIGEVPNGEEALIFVQDKHPHVIVMDVDMPVMDGIEATKIIISIKPNVKIIGLSLHETPTVKESMLKAGASAYLSKNEACDRLCATIRKQVI